MQYPAVTLFKHGLGNWSGMRAKWIKSHSSLQETSDWGRVTPCSKLNNPKNIDKLNWSGSNPKT